MFGERVLRRMERQTAVVHTKDNKSFRGVVIGVYHDAIVLGHVSALLGEADQELAGETVIPLANVSFLQRMLP